MEILKIYEDCLYSIKFDDADIDEYSRTFQLWKDLDYLVEFFKVNAKYVDNPFWKDKGLDSENPNASAERVAKESLVLASYIKDLASNAIDGKFPDFENYFKPLGGKYSYVTELEPNKSYGTFDPSLLRLYAIKLDKNVYLIVCGGIKLGKTIQSFPDLKDKVFTKIDNVLAFLKANGITESEDI